MTRVRRVVLDVLKPPQPNVLELGRFLAEQGNHRIKLTVVEMDEKTETLQITVEGPDVDFERVRAAIAEFGASLHSIDEVEVESEPDPNA